MSHASAKTGAGPMTMVAVEQFLPRQRRIVTDDLALAMLPTAARIFLGLMRLPFLRNAMLRAAERSFPGTWGGLMCRKRYLDDVLTRSFSSVEAIVNLGAGFDTRGLRFATNAVRAWEIDQPENIAAKRAAFARLRAVRTHNVELVAIDFDREDVGAVLASHGYRLAARTFFVWEGVTQYLTAAGIDATFSFLAKAQPGSHLVFTYVRRDFVDGRNIDGQEQLYERYVAGERIWKTGFAPEEIPQLLKRYGWTRSEDRDYPTLAARYVAPTGRDLAAMTVERIVHATKD